VKVSNLFDFTRESFMSSQSILMMTKSNEIISRSIILGLMSVCPVLIHSLYWSYIAFHLLNILTVFYDGLKKMKYSLFLFVV
jgi:hypothetical protein